ncbi:hypothetical protein GQ54DRAFT_332624 [Martensiomyces pterosporus]|nr:hypothetical protein GQ54DRAFT_332624 [Martensiomyces pterosporus]
MFRAALRKNFRLRTASSCGNGHRDSLPQGYTSASCWYTSAADNGTGKKPRVKYLAVKPESAAMSRMIQKIESGHGAVDVIQDIDAFRFTTDDLLRSLQTVRAQRVGDSTMSVSPADLVATANEETLEMLSSARNIRVEAIKGAFKADQLKEYLRANGRKATGTKGAMVNRIINEVWGISSKALEARFNKPQPDQSQDGMVLPLGDESLEQIHVLDKGCFGELENEFKVKIQFDDKGKSLRVTGAIHNVRAALSVLREKLVAKTTVEVDLARYGTPRNVSPEHAKAIAKRLSRFSNGVVSYFDGEFFVSSDSRIDALETQQALVDSMVEREGESLFVVVPESVVDSPLCTVALAADPFSLPHTTAPNMALHTSYMPEIAAPVSVLARHSLFERSSAARSIEHSERDLVQVLRDWVSLQDSKHGQSILLSAKLGKVLFDADSTQGEPLGSSFYKPAELLSRVSQRSPLFGFSSNTSPLKWLEGTNISEVVDKQLVLKFAAICSPELQQAGDPKASQRVPVYGNDLLVARVGVDRGKLRLDDVQVEHLGSVRTASVAILQSAQDFQLSVSTRQAVECTNVLKGTLVDVIHKLGLAGSRAGGRQKPHRHEVAHTPLGKFGLQSVEMVDATHRTFNTGFAVRVRQSWNMIEDLRYSEVELLPVQDAGSTAQMAEFLNSQVVWEKYLLYLFQSAMERPSGVTVSTSESN